MAFIDVWNEITNNVSVNSKGKKVISHSTTDFNAMTKALINDVNFEAEKVKTVNGEFEKETFKPAEKIRQGMIKNILVKAGHDRAEAEKLAMELQIDNVDGFYEFASEDIYQYITAGKKFNFIQKDDFLGSIQIDEVEEKDVEYKDLKTREDMITHQGAYKKLVSKSTCPANKKGKPKKK